MRSLVTNGLLEAIANCACGGAAHEDPRTASTAGINWLPAEVVQEMLNPFTLALALLTATCSAHVSMRLVSPK